MVWLVCLGTLWVVVYLALGSELRDPYEQCTSCPCDVLHFGSLAHLDVAASLRPTVAAEANRGYEDVAASVTVAA